MSLTLAILCLTAFAMVAGPLSALAHIALPWLDRLALRVPARIRAQAWLAFAALPTVLGVATVAASFLPAAGFGQDHCLDHGLHHPHLCPEHLGGAPGIVVVFVGVLVGLRVLVVSFGLVRGTHASRTVARSLAQASEEVDGVWVFPSDQPQAFVLGALRPRVHVSRALLAMGTDVAAPVLAHERAHARRQDSLWRTLQPLMALGHFPATSAALRARLALAQELAADAEAAETLSGGRLKIAAALLALVRKAHPPTSGIAFAHGDIDARVRALLDEPPSRPHWPQRLLVAGIAVLAVALVASSEAVHHGLESLLGALS